MERQRIIELIHRFGGHTVIESLLDPACQIFTTEGVQGLIGYHVNGGCAVVYGDPACAPGDRSALVDAFNDFCKDQRKNVVYSRIG